MLITTRKTQRSPRTKQFPALFGGRATCALCGGAMMTIQDYRGQEMRD